MHGFDLGFGFSVGTQPFGGASFNPAALFANGEQGAWYDPSDLSTMFQDSAGTTPVTGAGQPIGRQLDKSGQGKHRTQVTAAARPTLDNSLVLPTFALDGADDYLSGPIPLPQNTPMTHFAVFNVTGGTRLVWNNAASSLSAPLGNTADAASSPILVFTAGEIRKNRNQILTTRAQVASGLIGSICILECRGLVHNSTASTLDYGYRGGFNNTQGRFGEEIYVPESVAALNRDKIYGYLTKKWGITL